jgi:hypothetical protein
MARKNRARRRKTRTPNKITRIYARKTFLGYRKLFSKPQKKKPAFRYGTGRKTRGLLRDIHTRARKLKKLSSPSFYKKRVFERTPLLKSLICAKRRLRREIMFATNKAGKSGQKKPVRRNPDVTCRR